MQDHVEITRRIVEISKLSDELMQQKQSDLRIEIGAKLNVMANSLFAFYLNHLNNEEATILPLTWKYLTDDQLLAIRNKIQMNTLPERYAEWMRWILSSLNVNELVGMFSGMKMAAPPQVLEKMVHMAQENVNHDAWNVVKGRANL